MPEIVEPNEPAEPSAEPDDPPSDPPSTEPESPESALERQLMLSHEALEQARSEHKSAIAQARKDIAALEGRLMKARSDLKSTKSEFASTSSKNVKLASQNQKLSSQLELAQASIGEARESIDVLRDEVEKLTRPPLGYGTFLGINTDSIDLDLTQTAEAGGTSGDGTVDIHVGGRKLRVHASPRVDLDKLQVGDEVVLNESQNVVLARPPESHGGVVTLLKLLEDGSRALVSGHADEELVVGLAAEVAAQPLRTGDNLLLDARANLAVELLERPEVEELLLEEVPDVSYQDIGGLDAQIEMIIDAVELPYLHQDLFRTYELPAPKGILLYGPPGCGKTLIAKAVANSLAGKVAEINSPEVKGQARSFFINIKGPELLNKYVGETERQIRRIFERAREKADGGCPVIVFFDEMESLFRTRGSGISSDMESTVVPQLLAEIDGVEGLRNVIIIGASNREDLIDPAILRPGRLDVKIKIDRPNESSAVSIFSAYLTGSLPLDSMEIAELGGGDPDKAAQAMIETIVEEMYCPNELNRFLEVTYQDGDKEVMYFKDFASGAMIENIVRRAKKNAIKRSLATGSEGIRLDDLRAAMRQEFSEHEDLPNTTNPDDWAKISGKKGQRIVFIRTLVGADAENDSSGGRAIERVHTGQYL